MSFIYRFSTAREPRSPENRPPIQAEGFATLWRDERRHLRVRKDASTDIFESPDRLIVTDGEYVRDHAQEFLSLDWPRITALARRIRGNAVVICKHSGKSAVLTDTLGSFPLFTGEDRNDHARVYSPLFHAVRSSTGQQPDFTGVYQYLGAGYTVGDRSLDSAVKQFLPGEMHLLEADAGSNGVSRTIAPNPWADAARTTLGPQQIEESLAALRSEGARLEATQLMFSAGWDSRTILAGILSQDLQNTILAYSHGDTSSRELKIAGAICADHGVTSTARELASLGIDVGTMEDALQQSGQALFPQWRIASAFARQQGYRSLTGGIFGGILGGHYSVPSVARGARAQFASLMKYLYLPSHDAPRGAVAVDIAYRLLHRDKYIQWWCLKDAVRAEIKDEVIEGCARDARVELERLQQSGIMELEGLVEAYQVGQRGRQYMNGQIGICRSNIPVINPFTNDVLVSLACGLPLHEKIHNQANRRLLRALMPSLLKYPMAATFLPASAPVGLQELSRGARKLVEGARWKMHVSARGKSHRHPNMGWVNFEFLRSNDFLGDIIDSLGADFWDKPRMKDMVARHPATSMHPMFDMLCKIKTIDFRLSSPPTSSEDHSTDAGSGEFGGVNSVPSRLVVDTVKSSTRNSVSSS